MSIPMYPAYKPSGAARLGNLPAHWAVVRLKNVLLQRITDGPHTTPSFQEDGVPFLSVDGIQDGELRFDGCRFISESDHLEYRKKALPRRDDLLMGKAASTGKIARVKVDFEFSIWSPLALIRVDQATTLPAFVEYALKCPIAQAQIDDLCTSNTQKNISMDDIPRLMFARPPLAEQVTITTFLDHETAKIDALVEEQRRLIELLKEKRQAVISQAVTKGLDPNVPMRDSGVEWLGEVPAHWLVLPLKYVVTFKSGGTPDKNRPDFWDGDVPWASAKDLKVDLLPDTADHISEIALAEGAATLVSAGTVLVVVRGMILARTFPVVTTAVDMAINQDLKAVTARAPSRNDWLAWLLRASTVETLSRLDEAGHGTKALRMDTWGDMRVAVPPRDEQERIASFLRSECDRIDGLASEADRAITLLSERRSSLVSAAVTGKIDVRGLVPQSETVAA